MIGNGPKMGSTRMDVFMRMFPKANLGHRGIPIVCVMDLGWQESPCDINCYECWRKEMEEFKHD